MRPVDLERIVHRELRQLPLPRAPHTLLPRVLAAVQELSRRPWYARAWFTWPLGWRLASIAALVLLVAGGAVLLPTVEAAASRAATLGDGVFTGPAGVFQRVELAANAVVVVWRAVGQPLAAYAFAVVVVMCVICAAFGAALNYVLLERGFQR